MSNRNTGEERIAILPYLGSSGVSKICSEAILDLLSHGERPKKIRLLSSPSNKSGNKEHGFFFDFDMLGGFIILPGYASGYGGGGPHELSRILVILDPIVDFIRELNLDGETFSRLSNLGLRDVDIDLIRESSDYRGNGASDYIFHDDCGRQSTCFTRYAARLPIASTHVSLQHLHFKVFSDPVAALRDAHIVIEEALRSKASIDKDTDKFIDLALNPRKGVLKLKGDTSHSEQAGLRDLVKGVYQLHRNPRMHRSDAPNISSAVSEFLLLNHILFQFDCLIKNPEYIPPETKL